jgi:hypothetical protein
VTNKCSCGATCTEVEELQAEIENLKSTLILTQADLVIAELALEVMSELG